MALIGIGRKDAIDRFLELLSFVKEDGRIDLVIDTLEKLPLERVVHKFDSIPEFITVSLVKKWLAQGEIDPIIKVSRDLFARFEDSDEAYQCSSRIIPLLADPVLASSKDRLMHIRYLLERLLLDRSRALTGIGGLSEKTLNAHLETAKSLVVTIDTLGFIEEFSSLEMLAKLAPPIVQLILERKTFDLNPNSKGYFLSQLMETALLWGKQMVADAIMRYVLVEMEMEEELGLSFLRSLRNQNLKEIFITNTFKNIKEIAERETELRLDFQMVSENTKKKIARTVAKPLEDFEIALSEPDGSNKNKKRFSSVLEELRRCLELEGIEPVEKKFGQVDYNAKLHSLVPLNDNNSRKVYVRSLGVKIGEDIIRKAVVNICKTGD